MRKPIIRSLSVPGTFKGGSLHRMNSLGGRFRVVQASPSPTTADSSLPDGPTTKMAGNLPLVVIMKICSSVNCPFLAENRSKYSVFVLLIHF